MHTLSLVLEMNDERDHYLIRKTLPDVNKIFRVFYLQMFVQSDFSLWSTETPPGGHYEDCMLNMALSLHPSFFFFLLVFFFFLPYLHLLFKKNVFLYSFFAQIKRWDLFIFLCITFFIILVLNLIQNWCVGANKIEILEISLMWCAPLF